MTTKACYVIYLTYHLLSRHFSFISHVYSSLSSICLSCIFYLVSTSLLIYISCICQWLSAITCTWNVIFHLSFIYHIHINIYLLIILFSNNLPIFLSMTIYFSVLNILHLNSALNWIGISKRAQVSPHLFSWQGWMGSPSPNTETRKENKASLLVFICIRN